MTVEHISNSKIYTMAIFGFVKEAVNLVAHILDQTFKTRILITS